MTTVAGMTPYEKVLARYETQTDRVHERMMERVKAERYQKIWKAEQQRRMEQQQMQDLKDALALDAERLRRKRTQEDAYPQPSGLVADAGRPAKRARIVGCAPPMVWAVRLGARNWTPFVHTPVPMSDD